MFLFAQKPSLDTTLQESKSVLERISDSLFSTESVVTFIVVMTLAIILGRLVAVVLRRVTKAIGDRADKTEDLAIVTSLRRMETIIVLSIAAIRFFLVLFGLYFWWVFTHTGQQPTALLGAGAALTLILSGALFNILRDIASGTVMMAEHWYGVGDHIRVEPLLDAQGVVERVTLRSTRIRKFNGEVIWINNKDIAGVSVTPKGVRTIALELFARDIDKALQLIEDINIRLPQGALAVVSPLTVMTKSEVGTDLWHITVISEVAPGREWLLDKFAIDIMKELDEEQKILLHEPISRYADSEAERRFARTIMNARKSRVRRVNVAVKVARKATERNDQRKQKKSDAKDARVERDAKAARDSRPKQ